MVVARCIVFCLMVLWICGGPLYTQGFGGTSKYIRSWKMFGGSGLRLHEVRFVLRTPEGDTPIDRFETIGFRSKARAPKWVWRIERSRHLERVCRQLCDRLGPQADIRLYARRATRKGWKWRVQGEQNICTEDWNLP